MQIVIDIPENQYNEYVNHNGFMTYAEHLIKNGTPLPTVLYEIKDEIEDLTPDYDFEGFYYCQSMAMGIVAKHISGEEKAANMDRSSQYYNEGDDKDAMAEWVAVKNNIHNTEWRCSNCVESVFEIDPWISNKYCRRCGKKIRVPNKKDGLYDWEDIKKMESEE